MVEGYCRTKLNTHDKFYWPQDFQEMPRVGDYIRAKGGEGVELRVIKIIHFEAINAHTGNVRSFVEIELGL